MKTHTFAIWCLYNQCITLNHISSTERSNFNFWSLSLGSTRPLGQAHSPGQSPPACPSSESPPTQLLLRVLSLVFPKLLGSPLLIDSLAHSAPQQPPEGPLYEMQPWNQAAMALPQRAVFSFNSPWFTCIYLCLSESPPSLWAVLFFILSQHLAESPTHRGCLSDA